MKQLLRKIFSPILTPLEAGDEAYAYKPSSRYVLIAMGVLFSILSTSVLTLMELNDPGYFIPVIIFYGAGLLCFIVGLLGEDRAVAKIWGSK